MGLHNRIDWPVEEMRRWYEVDGLSVTQIANRLGRSAKLVWKVCNKHGFRMRPVGSCPGRKNPAWKGGRTIDKGGYILIWMPFHPDANHCGYVREHRWVASCMIGRTLLPNEVVHHKNGNVQDNRPENLELFRTNGEHLAATLMGNRPNWTDEGRKRIRVGIEKAARLKKEAAHRRAMHRAQSSILGPSERDDSPSI